MLPVALTQSSFDDNDMCYVLPDFFKMTSPRCGNYELHSLYLEDFAGYPPVFERLVK